MTQDLLVDIYSHEINPCMRLHWYTIEQPKRLTANQWELELLKASDPCDTMPDYYVYYLWSKTAKEQGKLEFARLLKYNINSQYGKLGRSNEDYRKDNR